MPKKILHMITTPYRATLEEQDDTILWLSHAMNNNGGQMTVLLSHRSVNYTIRGQDATGLKIGGWTQRNPPKIERDLAAMMAKGISVYFIEEDAADLGIERAAMIDGVKPISRKGLPSLMAQNDLVLRW